MSELCRIAQSIPSVSDVWGLHKRRATITKFVQNTRNKIVLPLFRFLNNVYDFSYRRQCFFREYISEMLYLGDTRTYLSTKRQGSIQMSLLGKLFDGGKQKKT